SRGSRLRIRPSGQTIGAPKPRATSSNRCGLFRRLALHMEANAIAPVDGRRVGIAHHRATSYTARGRLSLCRRAMSDTYTLARLNADGLALRIWCNRCSRRVERDALTLCLLLGGATPVQPPMAPMGLSRGD